MKETKRTVLRKKMCFRPSGHWLLGLSGGADSVALLTLLEPEAVSGPLQLTAVHVNHGLRGASSDGDEAYCRDLCESLQIPLLCFRPDLHGRTDELTAREARYACYAQAWQASGAKGILLAHHRDDQAETFLMHLLRGAGPEGLSGMAPQEHHPLGMPVARPLLRISHEELISMLEEEGLSWREDESNGDPRYLRNALRLQILPALEALQPGASGRIAGAAERIGQEHAWFEGETAAWLSRLSGGRYLDAEALLRLPDSLQAGVLRSWWTQEAGQGTEHALNASQTEAMLALAKASSGKINLPGNLYAERGRRYLHLTGFPREEFPEVPWNGSRCSLAGITLKQESSRGEPGDGRLVQEIPEGFAEGCILRCRRPGDRIRPFGMDGSRKLQDYLTDRGVDAAWRDQIPLLCRDREVLLVAGVGAGCIPRWRPDVASVRLQWQGRMPWIQEDRKEDEHGKHVSDISGSGTDSGDEGRNCPEST